MTPKDYKIQIKNYITNIKDAQNKGYLSIFAGAGVSKESGLPLGLELMDELKVQLNCKENNNSRMLAEIFYNQYGKNYYYQLLRQLIPPNSIPNELHKIIVKLNIKNLITTNWDNLFEKAINDIGQYYDIITSDEEIAHNQGHSKLIKMHGDLQRENIVFTDSDYLSYSDNFPLIKNYIKGVFSTDVVVIMGYSLNDENVKQIISWVNARATNIKPIYFVKQGKIFDFREFEFYKKKNIFIIYWQGELDSFLKKIDGEVDIEKLSIRDIYEKFNILKQIVDKYKKYRYIVPESFIKIITNLFGLWSGYYDVEYSEHMGISIRNKRLIKIYNLSKKFKQKDDKLKIDEYFTYFSNMIQTNIIMDSNVVGHHNAIRQENYFIDFDYKNLEKQIKETSRITQDDILELKRAFLLYQNRQFDESYHTLKKLASTAFQYKNHIVWFICEFNRKHFMFYVSPSDKNYDEKKKKIESYFKEIRKIDLQESLLHLPKTDRDVLYPLIELESFLEKALIKATKLKDKIGQDYRNWKGGGFSFNNNISQVLSILDKVSLLINNYYLTLEYNNLVIDFYAKALESILIFFSINVIKIKKEIDRQNSQKNNYEIPFDETIYRYIVRFYNYKELQSILGDYFDKKVLFIFDDYKFILTIFHNINDKFDNPRSPYVQYFNAFVVLNSFVKLPQDVFDEIIRIFKNKMQNGTITLTEYDCINYFIVNQYKRNKELDFKTLKEIIESYIDLFIEQRINYFYHITSLTHSQIFESMFAILQNENISLNYEKINIFLEQINKFDVQTQGTIASKFLVCIYNLLKDKKAQNEIQKFLHSLIAAYKNNNDKKIKDFDYFELCYLMIEYNITTMSKQDLNKEMEEYKKNNYTENINIDKNTDKIIAIGVIGEIQKIWKKQDD